MLILLRVGLAISALAIVVFAIAAAVSIHERGISEASVIVLGAIVLLFFGLWQTMRAIARVSRGGPHRLA